MSSEPQKNNTVLIIIAIIGVIGTIVASIIGAMSNYNVEKLRQDAELTRIALASSISQPLLPTVLPVLQTQMPLSSTIIKVGIGINFFETENKFMYVIIVSNASSKSIDDISLIISSHAEFPLISCYSKLVPYENLVPRQTQSDGIYTLVYDIPTLTPSGMVGVVCENTEWGLSFQTKYNVLPNKVPNSRCEGANDLSYTIPTIGVTARDVAPNEIEYFCE